MTAAPGLTADALYDALSDAMFDADDDAPLVAVAPCATFAVDAAEWDETGQRVVLRLREIGQEAK